MSSKTNVYVLGGAGLAIMNDATTLSRLKELDIDVYLIDSHEVDMRSNVYSDVAGKLVITDENGEPLYGGGANRKSVFPHISRLIPVIQETMPYADNNILISSGTGASGSMSTAVLVGDMMKAGKNVFVLLATSEEASLQLSNAIKSLETLQQQAANQKRNLPVMLWHCGTVRFSSSNGLIRSSLCGLIALLGGNGFDRHDVTTFIRPVNEAVEAGIRPLIIEVNVVNRREFNPEQVISSLTLSNGDNTDQINGTLSAKFGQLDEAGIAPYFKNDPLVNSPIVALSGYLTSQMGLAKLVGVLKDALARKERAAVGQLSSGAGIQVTNANDDGFVL